MTAAVGQSSTAALEDGVVQKAYEDGYTNQGSADTPDPADNMDNDEFWIKRARSSYESGQTWFDTAVRRRMEDNMRLFNSDHPRGSRYREPMYDKRSKLFRPKTRSSIRKMEAAAAAAFFATQDALNTTPPNNRDKRQRMAADALSELINYRLQHEIPWFVVCLGALQDAAKQGVVISRQQWVYREVQDVYDDTIVDAMSGESMGTQRTIENRVVADHPDILLRPIENILFSPASDWRNPVQTSPYLIDQEPFYAGEVMQRGVDGSRGEYDVVWRKMDMATIRSALKQNYDPVRQAREGYREDRYEESHSDIEDHDIVWVHHNYMRVGGQEYYYATLGTEIMLSDVMHLSEVTPLKERPYVMGICSIETHRPYPASLVELARPLQEEINDVTNLRIDNIRHVISPRYFIKRGTSVDVRSLLRNVAGGVTAMEDPQADVNIRQIQDTTGSSFQEQDRLSIEMDDVVGGFSQSSVASNHNVTERVGNTQMLGENANQITELTIRTFSETWVEKTLQQVMELERALESDEVVLAIIGQRMNLPAEVIFRMLDLPVKVTVNVGFGATNPQRRLQKVAMAFQTLAEINPEWVAKADQAEVVTEVLAAVGFKDAERFFPQIAGGQDDKDPQVAQLEQENEQLKAMIQGEGQKFEMQGKVKQMEIQSRERIEAMKLQHDGQKVMTTKEVAHQVEQGKWNMKLLDIEIEREQNAMRKEEMVQQRIALQHTIAMDERQYQNMVRMQQFEMGQQAKAAEEPKQLAKPDSSPISEPGNKAKPKAPNSGATSINPPTTPQPQNMKPKSPTGGKRIASTPHMAGSNEDKAGVIARGDYGGIPFKEG